MHTDPDSVDTLPMRKFVMSDLDPDGVATVPMFKIAILRADAQAAIAARDAIDDCFSSAWKAAHTAAVFACSLAAEEQQRLAKNPKTRHGSWRTPGDIELMNLGYL
jgi:hypothetical protein